MKTGMPIILLALALAAPWWLTRLVVTFGGCMLGSVAPQVDATQRAARPALVASLGLLALFASVGAYPHAWGAAIGTP